MRTTLAICIFIAAIAPRAAVAQSSEDMIRALELKPTERGLEVVAKPPPSIDLRILFEYDSDQVTSESVPILRRLGAALSDPRLASFRFRIAGHTDAKGSPEYNQTLSERRAAAVKGYLVQQFRVDATRLDALGFGKNQLADPARPLDAVNRRVQVTNLGLN